MGKSGIKTRWVGEGVEVQLEKSIEMVEQGKRNPKGQVSWYFT